MDEPGKKDLITPSQGIHIVLDKSFLPNEHAIMVPHTSDGRVMFAVPWHNHVVVGTTDTLIENHSLEPVALESEIDFVLETAGQYLVKQPTRKDILSVFAGLRPLAESAGVRLELLTGRDKGKDRVAKLKALESHVPSLAEKALQSRQDRGSGQGVGVGRRRNQARDDGSFRAKDLHQAALIGHR